MNKKIKELAEARYKHKLISEIVDGIGDDIQVKIDKLSEYKYDDKNILISDLEYTEKYANSAQELNHVLEQEMLELLDEYLKSEES